MTTANDGAVIEARGLGLEANRGWIYKDVELAAQAGSLVVILGPEGSGKTTLLLTLASRVRPTAGSLRVGGLDALRRRHATRALVGLGEFPAVNDLDETLAVHQQVMAELALHGLPWRHADVQKVLAPLGHEIDPALKVADLTASDRLLLSAALGLVGRPPVLALDRLDRDLQPAERGYVLERLRALTAAGVCVLTGGVDPALRQAADVAVTLPQPGCLVASAPIVNEGRINALA